MINYIPLTIGEFIAKLQQQPQENSIYFDFGDCVPKNFDSYRGYYAQLALGFSDKLMPMKVSTLLQLALDAQYYTFEGYKGGEYTMSPETPLWAANWGIASSTAIIDVITYGQYLKHDTRIVTAYCPQL